MQTWRASEALRLHRCTGKQNEAAHLVHRQGSGIPYGYFGLSCGILSRHTRLRDVNCDSAGAPQTIPGSLR